MFRRMTSPDGDAVAAAAQRRLAALLAHHATVEPAGSGSAERDAIPAVSDEAEAATPQTATPAGARHLAVRRAEHGRWGITAHQVTVAALVIVGLVVAVAWWALRSVPQAEPVELSSQRVLPSAASSPATADGGAQPSPNAETPLAQPPATRPSRLVVDVAGKVRHPGIVELPAGARVVDAIAAAGGARPGVGLTALNLARLLVDGEQIVVGIDVPPFASGSVVGPGGSGAGTGSSPSVAPVNLNTATAEQLDTLPGIGPVTAQAILSWRADNGPFVSVDDLLEVSGIGDATLSDLRSFVYV